MSKGKLIKFAEMETFPHVFQYPFSKIQSDGFPLKGCWRSQFFGNNNPVVVELGCGKGEYTVGLAKMFPQKNFIGIDIKGARIWSGAKQSFDDRLSNVAFIRTNIELTDHFFSAGEVDEIWITFPDPQMRKVRKRMTATNFLEVYRRFLAPAGIIHLKTDSGFMYNYTLEMAKTNGFVIRALTDNLYADSYAGEVLEIKTHYEKQWIERGMSIKYLQFGLHNNPFIEPDIEIQYDEYRSYNRSRRSEKQLGK